MKIEHSGTQWYKVVNTQTPTMFIGQFTHHLESKGRLSIPKKFRTALSEGAVLSQGLDGCLFLYPKATWETLVQKLQSLPLTRSDARSFTRLLSYQAIEVDIDNLGRILVPDYLQKFASITNDCVVAGAIDRVEIWDHKKFVDYAAQINSRSEELAEKLSSDGI